MKKSAEKACSGGWYASWLQTLRIMKLLILFVLVGTLQLSANVYSQSKVNLNLKDVSIKQLLEEIEKQTDVTFIYSDSNIDVNKGITVKADNQSLEDLLATVFKSSDVRYSMIENHVVLSAVVKNNNSIQQQTLTVTGKVTDINGEPLPGVNVYEKTNPQHGVITGIDGTYNIEVDNADDVIVFSYIGFTDQEVVVGGTREINITLIEETTGLDEVVVTALGIKRDKKALGYSVSSIKSDELVKSGVPVNPLTSLYGKAAGVKISGTANGPTGGMIINIRNSVSLTESSSTRPLFVVDGIPIFDENSGMNRNDRDGRDRGTGINDINAEDIESVEILKGAKASVLYGHAGANGVVLITTKSGKSKKGFGVEVASSYTWDNTAFVPDLQNEFGTGNTMAVEGLDADMTDEYGFKYQDVNGVKTPVFWGSGGAAGWGPKMDGREILWWDGQMRPYTAQPDNYSDLFQTGHLATNSVALSNAGEVGNFRFSYTNKQYTSTIIGAEQKNHILSFNGNINISDKIKLGYISNYYYTFNHNAPFRMQDELVTYGVNRDMKPELWKQNIHDETGVYWYFRDKERREAAGSAASQIGSTYFWNQTQNDFDEERHHFIQSANLGIEFTDWLSLSLRSGFDMTRKLGEVKKKVMRPLDEDPTQGYYSVSERNILKLTNQALLNFDKKINDDFRLSGFIGGVYEYSMDRSLKSLTQEFLIENWFSLTNSRKDVKSEGSGSRTSYTLYGVLGSAQIAFRDYLYLEVQGRNDWSSILPPANNSYFYPGVSLSWIASEALALPDFIKYAKFRASYADVGRPGPAYFGNLNFNVDSYNGIPYQTASSDMPPVDFDKAIAEGTFPTENLKPERKREIEMGFEANMFQGNRLGIDFSWFKANTYDQIMALDVPRSSGVNRIITNAGDVQNNGIELQLTGKPIMTNNFVWSATLNLAKYNTKIKKLAEGVEILPLWGVTGASREARVGGEFGEYYINPWLRDENGNLVVGSNGVYEFDTENQVKVGKELPDVIGGFNTNFGYKGFYLDFDFDFQFGGTLISQTNMYLRGNGTGVESLKYRDEARGGLPYYINNNGDLVGLSSHSDAAPTDSKYEWIFHDGVILDGVKGDGTPNDQLISAQQYYERTYWQGYMDITEDVVFKSDYLALRRITFAYEVPKKYLSNTFLTRARVSVFGTNIAYLYKDIPNVTPESFAGTNEFTEYSGLPGVRSYGFEVKLAF
ncbi:SusC/RagA family TonB-linked outer membrane protein [Carboxylicivirga sp. A043]|uniref:SusC/RagA family TonB-linked outer membrane protein n=1 Tax=Carboxylicivirga litoralis TaxID=2816963 RepID=UPI0021CB76D3|nr:SusC/RagA family TonB-linked outer membrane protein [Carboxylicivirga sp. A043]MCU4154586.1 SusC/RagA family TonB-linked outer membrane protein [Carboxylicivirga sp. A043]